MKSSTTRNLPFVVMRVAMLTAMLTIGFLPASPATSHFNLTKMSSLSGPAVEVLHYGAGTVGPSIQKAPGISAETVTQASIMWGSFVPQSPSPNANPTLEQFHRRIGWSTASAGADGIRG